MTKGSVEPIHYGSSHARACKRCGWVIGQCICSAHRNRVTWRDIGWWFLSIAWLGIVSAAVCAAFLVIMALIWG